MTKFATVNHDFHHDWTKAFGVHRTEQESLTKLRGCGVTETRQCCILWALHRHVKVIGCTLGTAAPD